MSAFNLIMLGAPGAGKGTQADRVVHARGIPKISTGDILREAVAAGTEIGRLAKAVVDRGELVGDEVVIGIVQERLARHDARNGFVLDGFPRTVAQARALDQMMDGRDPLVVVDIEVPEDVLVRRLLTRMVCESCGATAGGMDGGAAAPECRKCGGRLVQRSDDNKSVVLERLSVYLRQTKPLVEYYRTRPTFRAVDGTQSPDRVAADLDAAIEATLRGLTAVKAVRS
ncbi:MAG: adenylate kinase [Vicinamibacterales bacterium]